MLESQDGRLSVATRVELHEADVWARCVELAARVDGDPLGATVDRHGPVPLPALTAVDSSTFNRVVGLGVGSPGSVETVMNARPDVFNHNLETVPRLYLTVRPGARYFASLRLLERAKELAPEGFTKSGLMVGLGESREEIMQVMDDLRTAGVDFLTIGQYLQPSRKHAAVARFWEPGEFTALEQIARAKGFLMVSASPLTRSSYHADTDFEQLRASRAAGL